ncbi:MAG: acyltransferase [bacterium]
MSRIETFLSKVLHAPDWLQDRLAAWKRDAKLRRMHRLAIIGESFCYRRYNRMEGADCRLYNLNQRDSVRIGDYVKLNGTLFCNRRGSITIGDYTTIRSGTVISADNDVRIGRYCFISRGVSIYDNNGHPIDPAARRRQLEVLHETPIDNYAGKNAPVRIEDDVWIGERAIILKGVTIGSGAVVGAGAVVTKSVPAGTLVAGNPARVIRALAHPGTDGVP